MVQRNKELADGDRPEGEDVRRTTGTDKGGQSVTGVRQTTLSLDPWQREVVETKGLQNLCIRSGRQVGKSTVIGHLAGNYALENPKKSVMVISATERQAYLLFSKILGYLHDNHKAHLKSGKDRPTKSEIKLKNGTIIRCLPTGLDGIGIRGYTVDLLIADEAAYIPEDVWPAVTPMLMTTGGAIILLSTPRGTGNFFYNSYISGNFKTWHINAEEIADMREKKGHPSGAHMKSLQALAKIQMTKLEYQQEVLGEFTIAIRQILPDKLIRDHMTLEENDTREGEFSLGIDVARFGGDLETFEIIKWMENEAHHVRNFTTSNISAPETIQIVKDFDLLYKHLYKIYIDTGGMGAPIFDFLLKELGSKVVSIDNATRPIEKDTWYHGKDKAARKQKLMKEQGIMNLKLLLEQNKLWLLKDEAIFHSLRAYQWDDEAKKIIGENTHIGEGLWRSAWYSHEKVNKLRFDYM